MSHSNKRAENNVMETILWKEGKGQGGIMRQNFFPIMRDCSGLCEKIRSNNEQNCCFSHSGKVTNLQLWPGPVSQQRGGPATSFFQPHLSPTGRLDPPIWSLKNSPIGSPSCCGWWWGSHRPSRWWEVQIPKVPDINIFVFPHN